MIVLLCETAPWYSVLSWASQYEMCQTGTSPVEATRMGGSWRMSHKGKAEGNGLVQAGGDGLGKTLSLSATT